MDVYHCPRCHTEFVGVVDADDDYDLEPRPVITCPMCLRPFDSLAPIVKPEDEQGLDELFDTRGRG